jgi:hypothetical protein
MPDHAHLFFRIGKAGISTLVRRAITIYAVIYPSGQRHVRVSCFRNAASQVSARNMPLSKSWLAISISIFQERM